MVPRTHIAIALLIGASISACSWLGLSSDPLSLESKDGRKLAQKKAEGPAKTTRIGVEKLETRSAGDSSIEMIWEMPEVPTEGYIVRYGFKPDRLSNELRVSSSDLEKYEHPVHGYVYRQYLDGLPANQDLFISISAFNQGQESPPSRVFTLRAQEETSVKKGLE